MHLLYLEQFVITTSDEVVLIWRYIHGIDGSALGALQLSDDLSITAFPVPYLPVCTPGDDLTFLGTVTHGLEKGVRKHNLTPLPPSVNVE